MISKKKKILIISDGRPGHFNQTIGIAQQLGNTDIKVVNVTFRIKLYDLLARIVGFILRFITFNKRFYKELLKIMLYEKTYKEIISIEADLVLSAGSSVATINLMISKLKNAKSAVCMTPSFVGTAPFDLAIVPEHDMPKDKANIMKTIGAPNRINDTFMKAETMRWKKILDFDLNTIERPVVSVLLGGSNSFLKMKTDNIVILIDQVEQFIREYNGKLFITTSLRTPKRVEMMLKTRMSKNSICPLLIISEEWEDNPVPMMIAVSDIILVTEDSVSMISEAVSGNSKVIVVGLENHSKNKLPRFFRVSELLRQKGYIDIVDNKHLRNGKLKNIIDELYKKDPKNSLLNDANKVAKEINRRFFDD